MHRKCIYTISFGIPFFVRIKTVEGLDQRYILIPADVKDAYLVHTIDKYREVNPRSSIMVFVQTCK